MRKCSALLSLLCLVFVVAPWAAFGGYALLFHRRGWDGALTTCRVASSLVQREAERVWRAVLFVEEEAGRCPGATLPLAMDGDFAGPAPEPLQALLNASFPRGRELTCWTRRDCSEARAGFDLRPSSLGEQLWDPLLAGVSALSAVCLCGIFIAHLYRVRAGPSDKQLLDSDDEDSQPTAQELHTLTFVDYDSDQTVDLE